MISIKSAHAIYKTEYRLVWIPRYQRRVSFSQSAKAFKAKFPFLKKVYLSREDIWFRGYCVSSIGLNVKEILVCVEHQEKEDKGQLQLTFKAKMPPASAGGVSLVAQLHTILLKILKCARMNIIFSRSSHKSHCIFWNHTTELCGVILKFLSVLMGYSYHFINIVSSSIT